MYHIMIVLFIRFIIYGILKGQLVTSETSQVVSVIGRVTKREDIKKHDMIYNMNGIGAAAARQAGWAGARLLPPLRYFLSS